MAFSPSSPPTGGTHKQPMLGQRGGPTAQAVTNSGFKHHVARLLGVALPFTRKKKLGENKPNTHALDELVRAGSRLTGGLSIKELLGIIVDQALDISRSDLGCLYMHSDPDDPKSPLRLMFRRGRYETDEIWDSNSESLEFLWESREALLVNQREDAFFPDVLRNDEMFSGMALPLSTKTTDLGVLVLNARKSNYYNRERFQFLESFSKLAGGMMHNAKLFQELKDYLAKIEAMERYQRNIFGSMTNLLVTTDEKGALAYYNDAAAERFSLKEEQIGQPFAKVLGQGLDPALLERIETNKKAQERVLGIEGIYTFPTIGEEQPDHSNDMDFLLNMTPLKSGRKFEGNTLLFTDQTMERELAGKVELVTEERRAIKDMFSRYLSADVVNHLVDSPELVNPGGDRKIATVFFADIRGYTSFSEGKDPHHIIEVLNAYFSEAVEIVIQNKGYIDKFIGDCIMAAWGVPLADPETDAINAVSSALAIQKLVASTNRQFFRGDADHLKIGIGMHTGPLVAGNLGSARRMDYSIIGDTVNVAARLEGVAKAGEVIITENTKKFLGKEFVIEPRKTMPLKGKSEEVPIFAVLDKKSA